MAQVFFIASLSTDNKGGIHQYELMPDQKIHETHFYELPDCIWLTFNPNHTVLYASTQGPGIGSIHAYKIAKDDKGSLILQLLNSQKSGANCPCHLDVNSDGTFIYCANYGEDGDSSLSELPIDTNDGSLKPLSKTARHSGKGPQTDRQECPHIHCSFISPDQKHVCAVDLGIDAVKVYDTDSKSGFKPDKCTTVSLPAGSGPRHIIFDRKQEFAYVANELGNSVTSFKITKNSDSELKFDILHTISTLPKDCKDETKVAEIRFSKKQDALFVSNRGFDSIACYSLDGKGGMTLRNIVKYSGKFPRDFDFFPNSDLLASTNEDTNDVTFFKYDEANCNLIPIELKIEVLHPLCIAFL